MKATNEYFLVVLFIMLYKVVLAFESVDKILNESYQGVLPFGIVLNYSVGVLTAF